jgi:hypothetical protein
MRLSPVQFESLMEIIQASNVHARVVSGAIVYSSKEGETVRLNPIEAYKRLEAAKARAFKLCTVEPAPPAHDFKERVIFEARNIPGVTMSMMHDQVELCQRRIAELEKSIEHYKAQQNTVHDVIQQWKSRKECEERQADAAKSWAHSHLRGSLLVEFLNTVRAARDGKPRETSGPDAG